MPKFRTERNDANEIEAFLHGRHYRHLRTRHRADLVNIDSGPARVPVPCARLRRVSVHLWRLEMPTHTGRWEITPFRGPLGELLEILVDRFPWAIQYLE